MSIQIPSKTKIVLSVLHEDDQVGECGGQKGGDQLPVHLSRGFGNRNVHKSNITVKNPEAETTECFLKHVM